MIQKSIFLIMLVACIVRSDSQIDSVIQNLHNMDKVLQNSVASLLKKSSGMQEQLKNLTSIISNQHNQAKMANLEQIVNQFKGQMTELLNWKKDVDGKLNKSKDNLNMARLENRLQPLIYEIMKIQLNVNNLQQKQGTVQNLMLRKSAQMDNLSHEMHMHENKTKSDIEGLSTRIVKVETNANQIRAELKSFNEKVPKFIMKSCQKIKCTP